MFFYVIIALQLFLIKVGVFYMNKFHNEKLFFSQKLSQFAESLGKTILHNDGIKNEK